MDTGQGVEKRLTGGNTSEEVTRVGETVRKPWLPSTICTLAYVRALRDQGVDLPEPRGRDARGRLILEYVPGEMAIDRGILDEALLIKVGRLVRRIHDVSEGLPIPAGWDVLIPVDKPNLICHNDLATWNLVIDGDRLVFIDWDGAGPSTRLWDLAYAATSFGQLFAGQDVDAAGGRLVAFLNGYDADAGLRAALPAAMIRRAKAMHDLLQRSHVRSVEPWGSMYLAGHGEHWRRASDYIAEHEATWAHVVR